MTIAPPPPPPPPPANLEEFLARYAPAHFRSNGVAWPAAARFATELVRAADRGEEMSLADAALSAEDLYVVDDVLDVLRERTREFPPATALLQQVLREYRSRIEIVPPRREIGDPPGFRRRPAARIKPRPSPVFAPHRKQLISPPAVVAKHLHEIAASGEAAARFLRSLAAGVTDTDTPGQDGGADTTSLDAAAREAVGALLEAGTRAMRAQGKGDFAADLSQILGAWQVWARTPQQ